MFILVNIESDIFLRELITYFPKMFTWELVVWDTKKRLGQQKLYWNAGISRLSLRWRENDQVWYEVEKESSQLTFMVRESCPALWISEHSQYFTASRVIFFNFACTSDTIEGFKNYKCFHNFSKSIPQYCQWIIVAKIYQ